MTAYELWSGHILTLSPLVFVQDGLSSVLEPGWEVQLQQYRNGFVEKVRAGRDHHNGGQTVTQYGKSVAKPPVDSFATEPSQRDDDQHMADPERGQLNLEGAAEVVNQAKVLSKKNMKMLRKRPRAPKYVRHFVKLISELGEEHDGSAEFGPVEVKIWEVLLKCNEKGKKHLKVEEKIRRSKEKEQKKRRRSGGPRRRARRRARGRKRNRPGLGSGVIRALIALRRRIRRRDPALMIVRIQAAPIVEIGKTGEAVVLSDDQGLASLSFAGSTARNTSECGMASGKTALDRRVRNTVGRGSGRSRPRSSVADDLKAQGGQGGGGEIQNAEAARLQNGLEEFVAAEGEPFGSSYASILWGRLEPGTRLGYVAALRQFLR